MAEPIRRSEWLIDFDDTLAIGPINWAFEKVIPAFVRDHELPFDPALFSKTTLEAQKLANQSGKEEEAIFIVFKAMGWPDILKKPLLDTVFNDYRPKLFPDTLQFLERMAGQRLYIVSNNRYAPQLAVELGIRSYFEDVFTPQILGLRSKPEPDLWDYLTSNDITSAISAVMIGDDPWSDGLFAQHGPISCWILDRLHRYSEVQMANVRFISSLDQIENIAT